MICFDQEDLVRFAGSDLSLTERVQCAEMIFSALPQFYRLFPLPKPEILDAIAGQIGCQGTEFEECYALRSGETMTAIMTAIPAVKLSAAKKGGLLALMRKVQKADARATFDALTRFESMMDPAPEHGVYLARLGTVPGSQATGAGTRLLRRFLEHRTDTPLSLHVYNRNPARWLYHKFGFRPMYLQPREFCCMVLERASSTK